jgi:hypothetical protein
VPDKVTGPVIAVVGVKPVVPAENDDVDEIESASSVTTPAVFLKYSLPSVVLSASSTLTKRAAIGCAAAVELRVLLQLGLGSRATRQEVRCQGWCEVIL